MDAREWVNEFAERIGRDAPSADDVEAILRLAGVAAHASERTAAPVACWLAAQAGLSLDDALRIAAQIAPEG